MTAVRDVVIVGVGQLRNNRDRVPEAGVEPVSLIESAVRLAAQDAAIDVPALTALDAIGVVQVMSWHYHDVGQVIAERLGVGGVDTFESSAGGHQPVAVMAELARRLAGGEGRFALLCGGEAQSSLEAMGAHRDPSAAAAWSHAPGGARQFSREVGGSEPMWDLGLVGPIRVYPLFENRLRHELGHSFDVAQKWSADLYARFSEIASTNVAAWNPTVLTPGDIQDVDDRNRMICFPYPLRMNAVNRVDQAAAVLLATAEYADELGIPEDRRVHLWAAAQRDDCDDVLQRPSLGSSAGLRESIDTAMATQGLGSADLDVLDLYSCFPVVPKLASLHLGLDQADAPDLTTTGGLASFGGAHNNYSTHAVVATVDRLRGLGPDARALVYANGEYLTKHAAVVLANQAPPAGFVWSEPSPSAGSPVPVDDSYIGALEVETFTVEYDREGAPARGYVLGRTPAGPRTGVRVSSSDSLTLEALTSHDVDAIGRIGQVESRDGRRLFTFAPRS